MWPMYGRKWGIVKYYPEPIYNTITESFCGSASYSLYWSIKYPNKFQVFLVDTDEIIISIWKYLQGVSKEEILSLPIIPKGDTLENYPNLCQDSKWLIGFCINNGSSQPKLKASASGNWYSWHRDRIFIAEHLDVIRNWKIKWGDYTRTPDIKATHFIDPPYCKQGKYYRKNKLDYRDLAKWCIARQGQTIVCEGEDSSHWLPFKHLCDNNGQRRKTKEVIWTNQI